MIMEVHDYVFKKVCDLESERDTKGRRTQNGERRTHGTTQHTQIGQNQVFDIYIHGIHGYVKGGVGWEAVRRAYVMINSEVGAEGGVLEEVRGIPEVKEAHGIHGAYDVIALVEAETIKGINEVIHSKIRSIDKVRSTLSLVCT